MDSGFMPKGGGALLQLFGAPGEVVRLRELLQARLHRTARKR